MKKKSGSKTKSKNQKESPVEDGAITKATKQRHRSNERWLRTHCGSKNVEQNSRGVIDACMERKMQKRWKWSTLRTFLGSLMGAAKRSNDTMLAMVMKHWRIKDFEKVVEREKWIEAAAAQLPAYTPRQVRRLFRQLRATQERAFLVLMYHTAARASDTELIRTGNTALTRNRHLSVSVLMMEGKGAQARGGPYAVHTAVKRKRMSQAVIDQKATAQKNNWAYLFGKDKQAAIANIKAVRSRIRQELKKQLGSADLRGFRRGALQALSAKGNKTGRMYSGHTSNRQWNEYLRYGMRNDNQRRQMETAALELL